MTKIEMLGVRFMALEQYNDPGQDPINKKIAGKISPYQKYEEKTLSEVLRILRNREQDADTKDLISRTIDHNVGDAFGQYQVEGKTVTSFNKPAGLNDTIKSHVIIKEKHGTKVAFLDLAIQIQYRMGSNLGETTE